jgi:hypothetical protein
LTTAVKEMETAYTNPAGRTNTTANSRINIGDGTLSVANAAAVTFGGATAPLTPGVYTFGSHVNIGGVIVFKGSTGTGNGQGETDLFIIHITGQLIQ